MAIFREGQAASGRICFLLGLVCLLFPLHAVEVGSGFNTTAPTNSDIANWNSSTAWGASGITGWDYVGQINGASGVYLGNGWVLTAAHVGAGSFLLDGTTYSVVSGSSQSITTTGFGTADLILFQISTLPTLPNLTLSLSTPALGSSVAMLGYGGGGGNETWGLNSVTANNLLVPLTAGSTTYKSADFETAYGTTAYGTNNAQLIVGDSGGGDFIYNTFTGKWELAGINEGVDASHNSYLVQLSYYNSQIAPIVATPEPGTWVLLVMGLTFLGYCSRYRDRLRDWSSP